ncbi:internalin [Sorangium cellulosum]|uniref:Internalin n=2 Tax=Sorangium cellulosum TaxID=56 RepID=A0A2L0F425_SORCE|nr:internalin [Sorangium cellulosum]
MSLDTAFRRRHGTATPPDPGTAGRRSPAEVPLRAASCIIAAMNRPLIFASLVLALCLPGCDEPSKPAAPAASAEVAPAAQAPSAAPPAASPAAAVSAPPKRREVVCTKSDPVTFAHPALEARVRQQLQKPEGPIARAQLKNVKTLLLSDAQGLDELDPCIFPEFTGLKGLYLPPGKIDDLNPIKGLTRIESLRVSATLVKDLSPLAGLAKLDRLDIGRTPVSDLSPLAGLTNLTELQIDETEVTDLSPLAGLKKLEMLQMKRTRVSDVSPLRDLKSLKNVYIEGSRVDDASPLRAIPGIKIHEG